MKLGNETIKRQIQLVWDLEINLTADYYNHWGNNQREEAKGDNVIANYKERAATESKMRAISKICQTPPATCRNGGNEILKLLPHFSDRLWKNDLV